MIIFTIKLSNKIKIEIRFPRHLQYQLVMNWAMFLFTVKMDLLGGKQRRINPISPKRVATTPQTVFAPVLKNAQPRDKIAPGTFNFILSPQFSEKISNLPTSPGGGG